MATLEDRITALAQAVAADVKALRVDNAPDVAVAIHEAKGPLAHATATPSANGFMSAADKAKVDALKSAAYENVGTDPLDLPRNRRFGTAAYIDWEQFEAYLKAKYGLTQV